MRWALALALLPGLGTGLLLALIAGLRLPLAVAWPQLVQAHGQVQTLGFVLSFIVAVGLQLFPRFLAAPLRRPERATWGVALIAAALSVRVVAQPLDLGPTRSALLLASAFAVPAGVLQAGSAFHGLSRRSIQPRTGPAAAWRRFILIGGLCLGATLVLFLTTTLALAAGDILVDQGADEALIHLELAGFAMCLVFAVSSRIFGRFFLLRSRPEFERWLPRLAVTWGAGVALVSVGWLVGDISGLRLVGSFLEVVVACAWLWLIGLYAPPVRPSGTPYVTNPTRRWVRVAFALLVFGLVTNLVLFARSALSGVEPSADELSAARHALAQGFLLPMMVSMAARLLPIYSADVLKRRWLLEAIVDTLLVGAAIRVGAELFGGYGMITGPLIALGGSLSVAAFAVFAGGMWSSLGRLPGVSKH